jgi:type II secretory pathway pseudopilin PulG
LLELIVVMAMIGIITAISSVRIGAMMAQQRVTRAAGVVRMDLETAFTLASRNREPVHIVWNAAALTLRVTDRAEAVEFRKSDLSGSTYGLNAGDVTVTSSPIEVFPNGFASDTLSITISLTDGSSTYSKRIRISRAGLVKVI